MCRMIKELILLLIVIAAVVSISIACIDYIAKPQRDRATRDLKTHIVVCTDEYCYTKDLPFCEGTLDQVYDCLDE